MFVQSQNKQYRNIYLALRQTECYCIRHTILQPIIVVGLDEYLLNIFRIKRITPLCNRPPESLAPLFFQTLQEIFYAHLHLHLHFTFEFFPAPPNFQMPPVLFLVAPT